MKGQAWVKPKAAEKEGAADEWLSVEMKAKYIAYLDKNVPVPGKDFNYTSILNLNGMIHFETFLGWWKISLGWNEIAFEE